MSPDAQTSEIKTLAKLSSDVAARGRTCDFSVNRVVEGVTAAAESAAANYFTIGVSHPLYFANNSFQFLGSLTGLVTK